MRIRDTIRLGAIVLSIAGCGEDATLVMEANPKGYYTTVAKKQYNDGSRRLFVIDSGLMSGARIEAVDTDGTPGFEKIIYHEVWNEGHHLGRLTLEDCEELFDYTMQYGRERR